MKHAVVVALGFGCCFFGRATGQTIPVAARQRIEQAARSYQAAGHIPGMAIAVAVGPGPVWHREFGYADLENRVRVDSLTAFPAASVTKLFTAGTVLSLAGRGTIDLDQPVQRYCPGYPLKRWPVSVRQALTHQGGIRPSRGPDVFNRDHFGTVADAVARFAPDSLVAEPGTGVTYSNEGYVLLACVVEGATGGSFDRQIDSVLLRPLGLARTFPDSRYRVIPGISRSYLVRTAANTTAWRGLWTDAHLAETVVDSPSVADPVDLSLHPGAGNYRSTPSEVVRIVRALTSGNLLGDSITAGTFSPATLTNGGGSTGRSIGGWVVDTTRGEPSLRMLGSVWTGSFGVWSLPARGLVVSVASNVQFNQPVDLMSRLLDILAESVPIRAGWKPIAGGRP